jgi:hypothetical protein
VLPPVDASTALEIIPRVVDCLGALWQSGRLRSLTETDEGRTAIQTFEAMMRDGREQLSALMSKSVTPRVRLTMPEESSRVTVVFIRQIIDMMSDPSVVEPLGAAPLSAADRAFIEPYLLAVEEAVASAEFGGHA